MYVPPTFYMRLMSLLVWPLLSVHSPLIQFALFLLNKITRTREGFAGS